MKKKKILFVTNHFKYSNGVASVLRSLIDSLDENRYDVHLLTLYRFDSDFAKPITDKTTFIKGFGFYFRGFDKITNLLPKRMLYKKFVKDKFDLEIAFQFGLPTKIIAASNNRNRLCWMHGFDTKMVLRKYYERYPLIINVSQAGKKMLLEKGFSEEKCDYCYNIIDEEKILSLAKEESPFQKEKRLTFVTVGRLAPDKGFMRFLECIKQVSRKVDSLEFLIVGGGIEENKMRSFIINNGLQDCVKMVGSQKNPYKFMKSADAYFCCSLREGFSTTCQEAAILGIPVVSVDVNGANELVAISGAGRVIQNDGESIVSCLLELASKPEIVDEWKEKCQTTKTNFYKKSRIDKIVSILDKYSEA